jgi:hypothetical protein
MVSIVNSRFHCTRQGSLVGSTYRALSELSSSDFAIHSHLAIPLVYAWEIDFRDE